MTFRLIALVLSGGLLALATTTGARAQNYGPGFRYIPRDDSVTMQNPNDNRKVNKAIQHPVVGVNKKVSKSNTSDL
jgi:hypothetical protein